MQVGKKETRWPVSAASSRRGGRRNKKIRGMVFKKWFFLDQVSGRISPTRMESVGIERGRGGRATRWLEVCGGPHFDFRAAVLIDELFFVAVLQGINKKKKWGVFDSDSGGRRGIWRCVMPGSIIRGARLVDCRNRWFRVNQAPAPRCCSSQISWSLRRKI